MRARFRTPDRPVLFIFVLLVPRAAAAAATVPLFFFFFLNARPFSEGICRTVKYLFCPAMRQAVLDYFAIGSHAPRRVASRRFGILRPSFGVRKIVTPIAGMSAARTLIRFYQSTFAPGLIKPVENYKDVSAGIPSTMENWRMDFPIRVFSSDSSS